MHSTAGHSTTQRGTVVSTEWERQRGRGVWAKQTSPQQRCGLPLLCAYANYYPQHVHMYSL
jgi:hypothetical protein